jgi:hypothetical protein
MTNTTQNPALRVLIVDDMKTFFTENHQRVLTESGLSIEVCSRRDLQTVEGCREKNYDLGIVCLIPLNPLDQECANAIRNLKKAHPERKVIATGNPLYDNPDFWAEESDGYLDFFGQKISEFPRVIGGFIG